MTTTLPCPPTAASPYALLGDGERQIAAGRYREGSAMVYQAAVDALRAVAARRGWPGATYDDAHHIAYRLDGRIPPSSLADAVAKSREQHFAGSLATYSLLFGIVVSYKLHSAEMTPQGTLPVTFWKPDDYAAHLPMVKKFIDLLAAEQ